MASTINVGGTQYAPAGSSASTGAATSMNNPGNPHQVLPPLGMARNLAQANMWATQHQMAMNGLVPVPSYVEDEKGDELPPTNNGHRNPYTSVTSTYRRTWSGEGAHPTSAGAATAGGPARSGIIDNFIPLPKNKVEILRVLGAGPYYGYCLPTCDIAGLKEYHRLERDSAQQNRLTNIIKSTLDTYYAVDLKRTYLPYYYSLSGDIMKKPQAPQGQKVVNLNNGRSVKVKSFFIRDMAFYEDFVRAKEVVASQHHNSQTSGDLPLGPEAAGRAVNTMRDSGWTIHAHIHLTSFEQVSQEIQDGTLAWSDWSSGCCIDDHWVWHVGNQHEQALWGARHYDWRPITQSVAPVNPEAAVYTNTGYRYDRDLQNDDFCSPGHLDSVDGPFPIEHRGGISSNEGEEDEEDEEEE